MKPRLAPMKPRVVHGFAPRAGDETTARGFITPVRGFIMPAGVDETMAWLMKPRVVLGNLFDSPEGASRFVCVAKYGFSSVVRLYCWAGEMQL